MTNRVRIRGDLCARTAQVRAWLSACVLVVVLGGCAVEVSESVLTRGATSYWVFSNDQGPQTVFSTSDEQVTLHVKFVYNIVANTQQFRVTWFDPTGTPYIAGGVRTIFGSNNSLIVSLKIAGTTAAQKPGRWRVKLHYGTNELVSRDFELRAAR